VTADGQTAIQPFAIRREPTLLADVGDADLQKQFDLAMKIRDKTTEANEAVLLVRGLRPQIADRRGKLDSQTGPTAKALDDLEHALSAVEVEVYQVKNQSGQDPDAAAAETAADQGRGGQGTGRAVCALPGNGPECA